MSSNIPTTTREYYFTELGSGLQNLALRDAPLAALKANDVLVNVKAASLNYRDVMFAKNKQASRRNPTATPVPLSDGAGEIIAVGSDVTGWKVGDRVCANFIMDHTHGDVTPEMMKSGLGGTNNGVLTKYRTFPAHCLVRIPDLLSYEEAASLPCAAVTAYNALQGPIPVKAGDTVLVQGTGGVSIFALQFAIAAGATVIATSSSDEKLKIANKLGAKHLINYATTPQWEEEVLKITSGRGVDRIIEVAAKLDQSLKAVRIGGVIAMIGFVGSNQGYGGTTSFNVSDALFKAVNIRGIMIGSVVQFEDMNRVIEAHAIRPIVDKVFPFEEAVQAWEYLESQKHVGKVVIRVS